MVLVASITNKKKRKENTKKEREGERSYKLDFNWIACRARRGIRYLLVTACGKTSHKFVKLVGSQAVDCYHN